MYFVCVDVVLYVSNKVLYINYKWDEMESGKYLRDMKVVIKMVLKCVSY